MDQPLISCLMVTQAGRYSFFCKSVGDFLDQTYDNRELVVVTSSQPAAMADYELFIRRLNPRRAVRYHCVGRNGEPQKPLGQLRNVSNRMAFGDIMCLWDDDDRHHPDRLMAHYWAMTSGGAVASCLDSQLYYFVQENTIFVARWPRGRCPGILMYKKTSATYESGRGRGEDADFASKLRSRGKIVGVADRPELYLRVLHGANTWNRQHHWGVAKRKALAAAEVVMYEHQLRDAARRYDLHGVVVRGKEGDPVFTL